ncbi:putative eukaryotic translation initiation factor 3 subunit 11 [Mrakia frigida]|uniref:putative eukaryotic translation initiation factor 3 subunit 11 n=1 Tax=Mrakia frigida TaxID=29902 RepID=UPI003FCC1354
MPSVASKEPSVSLYPTSTAEWVTPVDRPEMIGDLIAGVDRYNPANLNILEDYLYDQVRRGTYDPMSNLATLKLYQFNPLLINPDVIVQLLLKALLATPGPDFGLAMAIIGDRANTLPTNEDDEDFDPKISLLLPFLSNLHNLLRTCQYSAFWALLNGSDEAATVLRQNHLAEHPLFAPLVRTLVVSRAIASTHQRISVGLCSKWFDLKSEAELTKFVTEELGWKVEAGIVVIEANEDNAVKGKTISEVVELGQLVKIIAAGGN